MKAGKTLQGLAQEIHYQAKQKTDMVVDTRALFLDDRATSLLVRDAATNEPVFGGHVSEHAHDQIAGRTEIPRKYYDRMRTSAPELLSKNVRHWFDNDPKRLMVRGWKADAERKSPAAVRALMSDRYQRIDNYPVLEAILPALLEVNGLRIESCEVTEQRLYIKAVTNRLTLNVKKGDTVQAGVMVTNSEIGLGAVTISPLVFKLECLNGLVLQDSRFRQHHVGARADKSDAMYAMLSDEALRADDRAIILKSRDVVKAALSEAFFKEKVERLRAAAEDVLPPKSNPAKAVEVLSTRFGFNEDEQGGILSELIKGGDLSRWGMINAVTRHAQDAKSYDRSTHMEMIGGQILDLPAQEWRHIAAVA